MSSTQNVYQPSEIIEILQSVQLFAQMPPTVLAEIANRLQQVAVQTDELVFAEGDDGDAMYIVVAGQVWIHRGGRTLTHLTRGEVFGEMALIDSAPRSASITATEPTQLLRLARGHFYDLVDSHTEVVSGVIHALCSQMRTRLHAMVDDHHYIQQVTQLTAAAAAVEQGIYKPEQIAAVTARTDELGLLARVFQDMMREVAAREANLTEQVRELRIEIDKTRQREEVNQITNTDFFKELRAKARAIRADKRSSDS